MKAIILAAGIGKRLKAVTDHIPKCLIEIQGRTLLERSLRALGAAGVTQAVVVIGYRGEMIKQKTGAACGPVQVSYITNTQYERGAILSLWSAREEFNDDLLIMDADVLFPAAMITRLIESSHPNCFLLDASATNTGEEMMLLTRAGRVLTIIRGGSGEYDLIGESIGFLKVSREDAPLLRSILDDHIAQGRDTIEHEETYPIFLDQRFVGFEHVEDLPWTEIDFPEDLEHAEREVLPRILALTQS
jgi:choline kinase